jgi:LemA protein
VKSKSLWIVLGVVVLGGLWAMGAYNRLVRLQEGVNVSWAQVENVLQRRYDLIPNLVNTVKGYAKHEAGILQEVTRLRSQWGEARNTTQRIQAAQGLESALSRLMVVLENYPNLKADQNFIRLQDELAGTENRIAVERKRFNESVQQYNTAVRLFPGALFARVFGFGQHPYFEALEPAKTAPKVEF